MNPAIIDQLRVFAATLLLGGVMGILYDVTACLLRHRQQGSLRRAGGEALFSLLAAVLLLWFLLQVAGGVFRGYIPLGLALGFAAHRLCLSRPLRRCLSWILDGLAAGRRAVGRGVLWMFSFPRGN